MIPVVEHAETPAVALSVTQRWRQELSDGRNVLRSSFVERPDTPSLLRGHARLVDRVIGDIWRELRAPSHMALVAVGGFGRGELFPHSDVDLLLLLGHDADRTAAQFVERLLGVLWDIGLEPGHSVRTITQCLEEMRSDATITTSLLEHRLLAGSRALYRSFHEAYRSALDSVAFYESKVFEQQQRHVKFHDAAYNLEPNVKESPGGLRDLQTVLWIARATGLGKSWSELAAAGLITMQEARVVSRQQRFIGALRVRLHYLAGRREDRLIFDQQQALAKQIGFVDTDARRASEQLMQRYYRAAKLVRQLNIILLQNLHARIAPTTTAPTRLNAEFQTVDELLDVTDEELFAHRPAAMLDAFLTLQRHPELKGMSARTLRALWRNRHRIDARFRADPENRARFLQVFREPRGLTHELRRMNLYGILGHYLPSFGRVVGQMQHDLFHVYTVDEHTLMVIRNLRRFCETQHAHEYPLCSRLIADFERREVLYLAGLFHDIGKGRGGDHSALGARDARRFCRAHGLSPEDAQLVEWLVANHLTMSSTAQKQDVSDPEVIAQFAQKVETERRLVALYLFTVADIRGTSPRVWNAWKAKLLEDLFGLTRAFLQGKGAASLADSLQERQGEARRLLRLYAVGEDAQRALWSKLDNLYFQHHTPDEIAWHARHLFFRVEGAKPVVKARLSRAGAGLQVFVYLPDHKDLFARVCGFFGRTGLSVVDAKIHTTRHGYALDTFSMHDPSDPHTSHRETIQYIEYELARLLETRPPLAAPSTGRISRHLRHFPLSPEIRIFPDDKETHYILEIVAGDRAGLLARIAYALASAGVNVTSAKINTLGDRAEDVFLVNGAMLHDPASLLRLETDLFDQLRLD
ncbi:MAG: [protein-PII] uridylyltransferase [Pseudomonadota bacterium]|nr:[protein-PII] uridylyltransferase [Pseudomonadota bacterium]